MSEEKIKFETDSHYVYEIGEGHYEVRKNGITHATVIGTFHFSNKPEYALSRAIEFCKLKSQ